MYFVAKIQIFLIICQFLAKIDVFLLKTPILSENPRFWDKIANFLSKLQIFHQIITNFLLKLTDFW